MLPIDEACSPFWPIEDGQFTPLRLDEAHLPPEAAGLLTDLRELEADVSIYLRGSVVEQHHPYPGADLDLFVVHEGGRPSDLQSALGSLTRRHLDIKWLDARDMGKDYVFLTLLAHRSMHVCGPQRVVPARRPDAEFCWRHWVRYCLAELPPVLACEQPRSVLFFKRLVRCYGVIMLLRDGRFTRDVQACISFAENVHLETHLTLVDLRHALENHQDRTIDISAVKRGLTRLFDTHWADPLPHTI